MNQNVVNIPLAVKSYYKAGIAVLIGFMLSPCLFALPQDQGQVIHFEADSADLSQAAHRGLYKGNVQLSQGSTHVKAVEAITEGNEKNQLVLALAKGNEKEQAHYWTRPEEGKPLLHAYADAIYYYPERHTIELIGNARVEQGPNLFRAPKIIYDVLHQHVVTEAKGLERTTIVIHPEKHP